MRDALLCDMRYHVIVWDARDIDSVYGPDSALIEDDNLDVCNEILANYLREYPEVYKYDIIDTLNNCVIQSWHK